MKLPNNYGSVIKLPGKRRKPYAVRISSGYRQRICVTNKAEYFPIIEKCNMKYRKAKNDYTIYDENDEIKTILDEANVPYRIEIARKFIYLEYFESSKDAYNYLAQMNQGNVVKEHRSLSEELTFKQVYERYEKFANTLKRKPSVSTKRADSTGFKLWGDIHDLRFRTITAQQLQNCLTAHNNMSKSSITRMGTVLHKMYKFGLANQLCDFDPSQYLFKEYSNEKKVVHKVYTDEEIQYLWDHSDLLSAKITLIFIYSGMRCSELLRLMTENIHLDERYMIGGIKTAAGENRIIPIHKRIDPIIRSLYNENNKYLIPNSKGGHYTYQHFRDNHWNKWKKELGMDHYTHDARHTFASKLEKAGVSLFHQKLIMGHSIRDLTQGTYTHVSKEALIADIDLWV